LKTYMPVTVVLTLCIVDALSPAAAVRADDAPAASAPAASASTARPPAAVAPIKSARTSGMVALAPDAALSGGRLVMRVVAYNGRSEPAQLSAAAIHITTATGQTVALIPLEQLIKEVSAAKRPKASRGPTSSDVLPGNFSHDTGSAIRDSTGNMVHGVNGGVNTMGADIAPYAAPGDTADSKESAAKAKQQIAALRAGILQTLSIEPRSAAGAQIVTEKLNFAAGEERSLHVAVDFNGEQHELIVPVPAGS
jgi:hypothetical protein